MLAGDPLLATHPRRELTATLHLLELGLPLRHGLQSALRYGPRVADLTDVLTDLRAEMADLDAVVAGADDLDRATPAEGWSIRDTVGHLAFFDGEALVAVTDADAFNATLGELVADADGFMERAVARMRALSAADLLASWRDNRERLVAALTGVDPGVKLPWYGPPMNPLSFATARLMEYWAHGQDVADALGVHREPSARLRHICHLGVRTRGFSYVNRGLPAPAGEVYVELVAPDGSLWTWGDPSARDRVTGTAEDFCLLVTQRRHRTDTALVAEGELAHEWLDIAQCFAGPPGPGRAPLG